MPPKMADQIARELLRLNLGDTGGWLAKPTRVQGLPRGAGQRVEADLILLQEIHYMAGYEGCSVKESHEKLLGVPGRPAHVGRTWDALTKARQRLQAKHRMDINGMCRDARAKGAADKQTGIAPQIEWRKHYDIRWLRSLSRGDHPD
jgi:hypothetical protein